MTDTSNSLSGEEPTSIGAPIPLEPASVAPSIDEFPTMVVGSGAAEEVTQSASMEESDDASTLIIAPAPLETTAYIAPPGAALPEITAPNYEAYYADMPAVPPQYTPLLGTIQAEPYPAPPPPYGQAGYYAGPDQQPGWTGGPVSAPRKPRRGWLVLTIVIVVLLVCGGTIFAIIATRGPGNTPAQVLQQYCDAYKTYNAQELYNTLDAAGKASTSVSQIQQSFDELKSLSSLVTISSCNVSNVQQNGSKANGTITLIESVSLLGISTSTPVPMSIGLVVENNLWKVDPSATKTTPITEPTFTLPTFPPGLLTPTDTGSNQ